MTHINYKEAARILGVEKVASIRQAANRGVLTKVPTRTQEQLLIREQVLLFKGKKQLRFTMLSEGEKKLWNIYNETVEAGYEEYSHKEKAIIAPYTSEELAQQLQKLTQLLEGIPPEVWYGLAVAGAGAATLGSGVPKGNPFLQKA